MSILHLILFCSLIITTLAIAYQDFKERLVSVWLLVLYGLVCLGSILVNRDIETLISNFLSVLLYLSFMGGILTLYFFIKEKRFVNILKEQLGLADVLILLFVGITFNIEGQILFFCSGFITALLVYVLWSAIFSQKKHHTIPLAGILVFYYLAFILLLYFTDITIIDCSFIRY